MLALITGVGGFGKTAHAIDLVFFQDSEFKPLEKYVDGISGLNVEACPHFPFPSLDDLKDPSYIPVSRVDADDEDADKYKPWLPSHPDYPEFIKARATARHPIELWFLWVTPGSVVVVDEVQRFFRPRPSGSKVPLYVSMLEYLRHFGCHFIGISQAPRLVDLHYRSLVEKHIHLDKTWKGGKKYEWVTCKDVESKADRKDAALSSYSPPKHVFPLYKSSSMHLKVKHKLPLAVKLLFLAIPLFIFLVWFAIKTIKQNHIDSDVADAPPVSLQTGFSASGVPAASGVSGVAVSVDDYLKPFIPVVPGRPETAPAYSPLIRVSQVPRTAACVSSSDRCFCYSQQGTRLREISETRCHQLLEQGPDFDPYALSESQNARQAPNIPLVHPVSSQPVSSSPVPSLVSPDGISMFSG